MTQERESAPWRWLSLAAVIGLLVVGVVLLGGSRAMAAPDEVAAPAEPPAAGGGELRLEGLPAEVLAEIVAGAEPAAAQADVDVASGSWWMGDIARQGGVAVYGVFYANLEGSALSAENVLLEATLPAGTTYVGDTSGLPVSIGPGQVITYDIGTLDPGQTAIFMLTVHVPIDHPMGPDTLPGNCVHIQTTTSGDPDPGNDGRCADPAGVGEGAVELEVNKGPEPGDPTPGERLDYVIGWCNNDRTSSGPVTMTDTLPAGVILEGWDWQPSFLRVWEEVYAGNDRLVLTAPGLPGGWCAEVIVHLRLEPDIPPGTVLSNLVELAVADDVNPQNNWRLNEDAQVGPPRVDAGVGKRVNGGILTPGGRVGYGLEFGNHGNVAAGAWLTDILPAGFSYLLGTAVLDEEPFVDPVVLGNQLVWDLGALEVNEGHTLQFDAAIEASPGIHENCAQIGLDAEDGWPEDNEACAEVRVFRSGPNLHVEKYGTWEGEGIYYQIFVANYGDVPLFNVSITDTYPVGTTSMPGVHEPELPGHLDVTATSNYTDNQWLFEIQEFGPGEGAWINFPASVDEPELRPAVYTNTVEIEVFAQEVHPADNYFEQVISRPEVDAVEVFLDTNDMATVWGQAPAGAPVTVTAPGGVFYATAGDGGCPECWEAGEVGVVLPGELIIVEALGGLWPVVVEIPDPFTAEVDRPAGRVEGWLDHLDNEPVEVRGWWEGGWQEVRTEGGYFEANYDWIPPGGQGVAFWVAQTDPTYVTLRRFFQDLDLVLEINYGHDWVEGPYEPGHTVWLTVTDNVGAVKATAELQTQEIPWWDGGTGFSTNFDEPWVPEPPDLMPYDRVYGRVDNGRTAEVQLGEITGLIDAGNDSIEGAVLAPWLPVPEVPVECMPWGGPDGTPNKESFADPQDGDPGYFCQWDPATEWDVMNGQQIGVSYREPDDHQVIAAFEGPWTQVNYADDWVGINYPAGHTVVVTVTDGTGMHLKGVAEFETTSWDGWNGPGYQTRDEDWISPRPDINHHDWVHFASDDGYRHSVQVGHISGSVSAANDRVSGYLYVDWWNGLVPELAVECQPWGAPHDAPSKDSSAPPNASAPFACEWDRAQEWDILPGQQVAVMYIEPDDSDRIVDVWHDEAPDLRVEKWVVGSGEVQYDGLSVWAIQIRNQGDAPADTVVLTDVLPVDTSYLLNSSGQEPADPNSPTLVWTFDSQPLLPGEQIEFILVLQNNLPEPGVDLHNEVWVWAEFDVNPDNNSAGADVWATDLPPGMLHIGKDANPGDPAPGSTYLYQIGYGNYEPAATGPVVMTDTIPAGTSIVGWYSQNGYGLWEDYSTPDQLILVAPVLPGHWDDTIVLRLRVDPGLEPGTQLVNWIEIEWPDGYEFGENGDAHVGEPYRDVWVEKGLDWATLVPGGQVQYNIRVQNQGNMTATVVLTDSVWPNLLDIGDSWCHDGNHEYDCPFIPVDDRTARWELGEIPPGGYIDVGVVWWIQDTPTYIGVSYENCAEVAVLEGDDYPYNNAFCTERETIREWGPNLRVRKDHQWQQEGDVLHYDIQVENVGSQGLDNVLITDIYPEGTSFYGSWGVSHGPWITVTHDAPSRELVFWADWLGTGETAGIGFDVSLLDADLRPAWYTNTLDAPVDGDVFPDDNYWQDVAVKTEIQRVELWVNDAPEPSSMWGEAEGAAFVTVTTPYTTVVVPVGQPECDVCWNIDNVGLLRPSNWVDVRAGAGLLPVRVQVPNPFDADVDSDTNEVWGRIGQLSYERLEIHGQWQGGYQEVDTDINGNFLAEYEDIPRGAEGYVRFVDEVDYAEVIWHRPFLALDLILEVNYGHDWVQGQYEPGHTVWITVTESDGLTVKGTAEMLTQAVPEWGDFVGFATNMEGAWAGDRPDIVPGDWVFGRVDDGQTSEVEVGEIAGLLDVGADWVDLDFTVPWPEGTMLDAWCSVWVEDGPGRNFQIEAVSDGHRCEFGGEWDLMPGEDVGVGYIEPDQDQVINVFYEPVPDMSVHKWVPGHGEVQHDGASIWRIQVRNDGEAAAASVFLTDTMPTGSWYAANSSGVEPDEIGDQLIWDFGPMAAGEEIDFVLVLYNAAPVDTVLLNQVDVWAEWDSNPDNNHAEAEVWATVIEPPELGADKHPEPGDPAPGQTFLYQVNVGNNGPALTGPVRFMDIIPAGTSVVDWWTDSDWPAWEELDRNGRLYLQTVALPGYWGDSIWLQLLVEPGVEPGTQLTNTVRLISPDSSAVFTDTQAVVGEPRRSAAVSKDLEWGVLVPGGEVSYNLHVRNQGNTTAGIVLTETLPAGTFFKQAWYWMGEQSGEMVPASMGPDQVVFDLGELEPGRWTDLSILLGIKPEVVPGTTLLNCARINRVAAHDWPDDNEDCVAVRVQEEGPNLRVRKEARWNHEGQLQYYITFWNLGTETLYDRHITDTPPDDTHWIDEWWQDYEEPIDFYETLGMLVFVVSRLEPGWRGGIGFNLDLDTPEIEGKMYKNEVVMSLVGDTWPYDNYWETVSYSGPDLYVIKELTDGEPRPGAVLTYTIEFGNKNDWPWDSDWLGDQQPSTMIVDTLPEGMTFITATAPWNPDQGWMPDIVGQELRWGFGPMNGGESWKFELVAEVSPTAEYGDVLTNTVTVESLSPHDTDPRPYNNDSGWVVPVLAPAFTIGKQATTSGVAGTMATYRLAVENVGNDAATGVGFADSLPDDLTYVDSDGVWDGAKVEWTVGSMAPGETAEGWFSAGLTCEAGVRIVNDRYMVGSDQGATAGGTPVTFTTVAPTIELTLTSAPDPGIVGELVTLTATASTDGTPLTYKWDYGDGPLSGGLVETNVWDVVGSFTVVFTATDECDYSETVTTTVTIEEGGFTVYLPVVLRRY